MDFGANIKGKKIDEILNSIKTLPQLIEAQPEGRRWKISGKSIRK